MRKLKSLLEKGIAHVIVGTFIVKFTTFFSSIFLIKILNKSDYGLLNYVENIYNYFYLFAGYGLSNAVLRFCVLPEKVEEKKASLDYILQKGTLFNVGLCVIACIISLFYPHPSNYNFDFSLLFALIISIPFKFCWDSMINVDRAMFNSKRYAYFSIITSFILIGARLLGAAFYGIFGVILGVLFARIFNGIILLWSGKKRYFCKVRNAVIGSIIKKNINSYSIQYMITNGIWSLFTLNDTFFLSQILNNPDILAEYRVAAVFPTNLSILSMALGIFIAPYFTQNEQNEKFSWVRKNWLLSLGTSMLLTGICALLLGFFAENIVILFYGEQYISIVPVMRILLFAHFINGGFRYTTANILAAMGEIKYNMLVSFGGIILQIILDYFFVIYKGMIGVAWANVVVYFFMAIILNGLFIYKYFISVYQSK